jgi:hypothetical protein
MKGKSGNKKGKNTFMNGRGDLEWMKRQRVEMEVRQKCKKGQLSLTLDTY